MQWQGELFKLTQEELVEGGTVLMPIGTWVCKATWYSRVHHAPGWYERESSFETNLYRLQMVATPDVMVESFNSTTGNVPPPTVQKEYNQNTARGALKYIPNNQFTLIQQDIFRLEKLEPLPLNHEVEEMEEDTSNDDDENMDSNDEELIIQDFTYNLPLPINWLIVVSA